MADMKISELSSVASLNNGDLIEVSQVDSSSPTGYSSMKASMTDVGNKVNNNIQYTQDLETIAKTIIGAVNEVNGKVNVIGTIVNGSSTGGSAVFTRTWAAKASITLTKGVWIISTRVILQQDNNGYRALNIATTSGDSTPQCTSPAVNGNLTALNMSVMQNVTSSSATFYLNGVHNSTQNSELSMISWYLNAVRIA